MRYFTLLIAITMLVLGSAAVQAAPITNSQGDVWGTDDDEPSYKARFEPNEYGFVDAPMGKNDGGGTRGK